MQQRQYNNAHDTKEKKLISQIKEKLRSNKADKGNSIVIISKESYHNKIQNFVDNSNCINTEKGYTNRYQKDIINTIKDCPNLIHRDMKKNAYCVLTEQLKYLITVIKHNGIPSTKLSTTA